VSDLLDKLRGGDRRSIGRSEEVVADVLDDPSLFDVLFCGMLSDDPLVRMRAADAAEKVTARHPEYLEPYRERLLGEVAEIEQQEVRWHVAQMLPRLAWGKEARAACVALLLRYLEDASRIVKTSAMQALAEFAERDPSLRLQVLDLLQELTRTGSPAMRSRGRKLVERLQRRDRDG
jgi:hypothetical protein